MAFVFFQWVGDLSGRVMGRLWWGFPGLGRAGTRPDQSNVQRMGRGLAQLMRFSAYHGPGRPDPAHCCFQSLGPPGPARHMAATPMGHGLCMGQPDKYVGRPVDLTGRPMRCPVLNGACA